MPRGNPAGYLPKPKRRGVQRRMDELAHAMREEKQAHEAGEETGGKVGQVHTRQRTERAKANLKRMRDALRKRGESEEM